MVGWLGPETPVSELFDLIPALDRVFLWVGRDRRYERATRNNPSNRRLSPLTPGRGFWMYIGGTATIEWIRPVIPGPVLLSLHAGQNLAGWTGPDGIPIEEALARFGDALTILWRWNAETQQYEHYRPGAADSANTLRELHPGDAFWVDLSSDARWLQSGTANAEFVFRGYVTPEVQSGIRAMTGRVMTYFAERYGIEPPRFTVITDPEGSTNAAPGLIRLGEVHSRLSPSSEVTIAHEYFHVLQFHLRAAGVASPRWMTEGTATYAQGLYAQSQGVNTEQAIGAEWWRGSLAVEPLLALQEFARFYASGAGGYFLGALATDWLIGRPLAPSPDAGFTVPQPGASSEQTEDDAYIEYFELLATAPGWEEAFETAFGISVGDFHEQFEDYRVALGATRLPHLADEREEPVLALLGEIPPETADALRAEFANVQALFNGRLGAGPADYTVYVAADAESLADAYARVYGEKPAANFCEQEHWVVLFSVVACRESLQDEIVWLHFNDARDRLAPRASLPLAEYDTDVRGPYWLLFATEAYVRHVYEAAAGAESPDQLRASRSFAARRTTKPLSSMETATGVNEAGQQEAEALSFLAAEWLAGRSGEGAFFEYYRLLPSSATWHAAFEGAFGLAPVAFYSEFDRYVSENVPLLPHVADDRDAPVLLLLGGDVSPEEAAAVRADFEAVQEFFNERLGAPAADYTVYVAANDEEAAPAFRQARGEDPAPGFCFTASQDSALVMTLDCGQPLANHLGNYHYNNVLSRLQRETDYADPGPLWLRDAIQGYARYGSLIAARPDTAAQTRAGLVLAAQRTTLPLSSLETYDAGTTPEPQVTQPLGYFVAERLVERAGEWALLDYYRQRSKSEPWHDTFEAVFGISADDFYEEFEAYRMHVVPPQR